MADRTAQGKPVDSRAANALKRNMRYEISSQELALMKQQNQILDAEENIERMRASIASLKERVATKKAELSNLEGEKVNG